MWRDFSYIDCLFRFYLIGFVDELDAAVCTVCNSGEGFIILGNINSCLYSVYKVLQIVARKTR